MQHQSVHQGFDHLQLKSRLSTPGQVAHKIYHTMQYPNCRLCKQHSDTEAQIINGYSKLAETEYTERHNNVASILYKAICAEYNLEHRKDCWIEPEKVIRNNHAKIHRDFPIQTDNHLLHNWPDILLINDKKQTGLIIDIAEEHPSRNGASPPACSQTQSLKMTPPIVR